MNEKKELEIKVIQDQMRKTQTELIHLYLLLIRDYPDKARETLEAADKHIDWREEIGKNT